jgi:uncharacterized ParB-like nuclease family protein
MLLFLLPLFAVSSDCYAARNCPRLDSVIPAPAEPIEAPVPIDEALIQAAENLHIPVAEARSRLEKIPFLGPTLKAAKAKIVSSPGLMGKILKDQLMTPVGLFLVNPHDPEFFLKWATLSPTRTYLVTANALEDAGPGIKNFFESGASWGERGAFFWKKCKVQAAVGFGAGAAAQVIKEALDSDHHQALSEDARDVLLHATSSGSYFFLTACIRYQALDRINREMPKWLNAVGVAPEFMDTTKTVLMTSFYLGNAYTSGQIYGAAVKAEGWFKGAKPTPKKMVPVSVKLNRSGLVEERR